MTEEGTNFRTIQKGILDLNAREHRPGVELRDAVELGKLPCAHIARADVAHLPALHEVVQRAHRLLKRRRWVERVHLKHVDVWGIEAFQGRLDLVEERRT